MKRLVRYSQWQEWMNFLQQREPASWIAQLFMTFKEERFQGDYYSKHTLPGEGQYMVFSYSSIMPRDEDLRKHPKRWLDAVYNYLKPVGEETVKKYFLTVFPKFENRIEDIQIGPTSISVKIGIEQEQSSKKQTLTEKMRNLF
jgi:hypothetical protein